MKIRNGIMVSLFIATITLAACGGGGGGGGDSTPPPPDQPPGSTITPATPGTLIASPNPLPITAFTQNVRAEDGGNEIFPSQANVWDIGPNFTLINDQFSFALFMTVGATAFPEDQKYGELTFYTPAFGLTDGVKVADTTDGITTGISPLGDVNSVRSAILNATSDSRLQQTLNLTSAPTGTAIILTWEDEVVLEEGNIAGYTPGYRVVVRSAGGTELQQLFSTAISSAAQTHTADLTAYRGQSIVLSFEYHSSRTSGGQPFALIDSVSVRDNNGTGTEYVLNGGFEGGVLNWNSNSPAEIQNTTSGARTLEGLSVKRSFYTVPNNLWGRWVDVFENPTGSPITTTVKYETSLSSGGAGIIYAPLAEASVRALTSWDGSAVTRDIGMVFGNATTVDFRSASSLGSADGKDVVTVTYDITVPASGRVAIVNFIMMNGKTMGKTATATTARVADIDTDAFKIITKFWSDAQYRNGMTQEQMDAISNFPKPVAQ